MLLLQGSGNLTLKWQRHSLAPLVRLGRVWTVTMWSELVLPMPDGQDKVSCHGCLWWAIFQWKVRPTHCSCICCCFSFVSRWWRKCMYTWRRDCVIECACVYELDCVTGVHRRSCGVVQGSARWVSEYRCIGRHGCLYFNSRSKSWMKNCPFLPTLISRIILTAPFISKNKIFHPVSLLWQPSYVPAGPHLGVRNAPVPFFFAAFTCQSVDLSSSWKKQLLTWRLGFVFAFSLLQSRFPLFLILLSWTFEY